MTGSVWGDIPGRSDAEERARELWLDYYRRTEAYDRTLEGRESPDGSWLPRAEYTHLSARHAGELARERDAALAQLRLTPEEHARAKAWALRAEQYAAPDRAEGCAGATDHEYGPGGYVAFFDWARARSLTHRQTRCPKCRLWVVWVKRR